MLIKITPSDTIICYGYSFYTIYKLSIYVRLITTFIVCRSINTRESGHGRTALHIAVRQESERVVAALLTAGADAAAADTANADTPLHFAAGKPDAIILVSFTRIINI